MTKYRVTITDGYRDYTVRVSVPSGSDNNAIFDAAFFKVSATHRLPNGPRTWRLVNATIVGWE